MVKVLTIENCDLAREVDDLKKYNEQVSLRSRHELMEVQQQISSVEAMAEQSKSFQAKFESTEAALRRQRNFYEQQLQRRDGEIETLETSIKFLQSKLSQASQTPRALLTESFATPDSSKNRSADDVIKSLVAEKEELNSKYKALAAKFEEQDLSMQEYCKQVKKLGDALEASKESSLMNPSIQAQLLERQKREAKLLKHLQELEGKHSELLGNFEIQAKENSDLKESALKLEQRLKNTDELIKQCEGTKQEALSKVTALQRECAQVEDEKRKEIEKIEADKASEKAKLEEELRRSKIAAKSMQLERDAKIEQIKAFKNVSEQMQNLAKESKKEVDAHREMSSKLNKDVELLKKELSQYHEKCEKMQVENKKLSALFAAAQKSDTESKNMLVKLNEEVRKKLDTIKTEYQRVTSELQMANEKSNTLQEELKRVNKQKAEKQTGAERLQIEKVELDDKMQQLQTHCQKLEGTIGKLKEAETKNLFQLSQLEQLLKDKSSALAAKNNELKIIESGFDSETKSLHENLSQKNAHLSEKCSALEDDVDKLRAVEESNKTEIKLLRKENEGLQHEIRELTEWVKTKAMGQLNSGDSSSGDVEDSAAGARLFGLLLEQLIFAMENKIKTRDEKLHLLAGSIEKLKSKIANLEQRTKLQVAEVSKEQRQKFKLEAQLKNLSDEKAKLEKEHHRVSQDQSVCLEELESANNKIISLQNEKEKHFEILEESDQKFTELSAKIKALHLKNQGLEKQNQELHAKLVENVDLISQLTDANRRQKHHMISLQAKEKSRAEIQKQLQEFADEYKNANFPKEVTESPLHVLECLIDKFGANSDQLQYLKLCKTLRNRLLADEKKTQLADQIVTLMTSNKKHR